MFLGQLFGWLFVILGLIFLLKKNALVDVLKAYEEKGFVIMSGYVSLLLGLPVVIVHNVWVSDWRVVVTILGWTTLIKGVARIGFPEVTQKKVLPMLNAHASLMPVLLGVAILLGAWLVWMSY